MLIKYERVINFNENEIYEYFMVDDKYTPDILAERILTIIDVVFPIISEHELQECIMDTLRNEGIIKLKERVLSCGQD